MKEKHDADEADDDGFENQITLERVNRFVDEPRTVVAGDDFDARR